MVRDALEEDEGSETGAWWLQSVRLRRQAIRTSASSMSTPTTRRAPHDYLARYPTFVAAYIKYARIGEEVVGQER